MPSVPELCDVGCKGIWARRVTKLLLGGCGSSLRFVSLAQAVDGAIVATPPPPRGDQPAPRIIPTSKGRRNVVHVVVGVRPRTADAPNICLIIHCGVASMAARWSAVTRRRNADSSLSLSLSYTRKIIERSASSDASDATVAEQMPLSCHSLSRSRVAFCFLPQEQSNKATCGTALDSGLYG
jgi:hypothetical protein